MLNAFYVIMFHLNVLYIYTNVLLVAISIKNYESKVIFISDVNFRTKMKNHFFQRRRLHALYTKYDSVYIHQ